MIKAPEDRLLWGLFSCACYEQLINEIEKVDVFALVDFLHDELLEGRALDGCSFHLRCFLS